MTTTTFSEHQHPRGAAGKFTHMAHSESSVSLGTVPSSAGIPFDEHYVSRVLAADLSAADARAIAARVSAGLDFRPETIRAIANDHHRELYGVTLDEHDRVVQNISRDHHGESAIDHMRRMMAAAREKAEELSELAASPPGHEADYDDEFAQEEHSVLTPAEAQRCALARGENVPMDVTAWHANVTGDFERAPARTRYSSTSAFVREGGVADTVISPDGAKYYRARPGVILNNDFSSIRIQANRPISDEEMAHLAQLTGYNYACTVRGEEPEDPERDTPYCFTVFADATKGSGTEDEFDRRLACFIHDGSRVRKTNKSGPITRGTRLVEPCVDAGLDIEVYYDDVFVEDEEVAYNAGRRSQEYTG